MSVGLLLITHQGVGAALLNAACRLVGGCPLPAATLDIALDSDPIRMKLEAELRADELDQGEGVLVLTDLYGATPCNIACRLSAHSGRRVVAGLNLPMLMRVLNYTRLPLAELAAKAESGARDGVVPYPPHNNP
jgi:PTS system ascorbate-specific IIA component